MGNEPYNICSCMNKFTESKHKEEEDLSGSVMKDQTQNILRTATNHPGINVNNIYQNSGMSEKEKISYDFNSHQKYVGEIQNNQMHGFGMIAENGNIFLGYFNENLRNGYGTYFFKKTKAALLGYWVDGKTNGFAIYGSSETGIKYWGMVNGNLDVAYDISDIETSPELRQQYFNLIQFYSALQNTPEFIENCKDKYHFNFQ